MENKSARAKVRLLGAFDCNGHPNIGAFIAGIYNGIIYSHRLAAE